MAAKSNKSNAPNKENKVLRKTIKVKERDANVHQRASLRAGRKSTIITTNLGFDRWEEIFGDQVLTAALVDRLTHKAHLVNMNGESYRLMETQKVIKK